MPPRTARSPYLPLIDAVAPDRAACSRSASSSSTPSAKGMGWWPVDRCDRHLVRLVDDVRTSGASKRSHVRVAADPGQEPLTAANGLPGLDAAEEVAHRAHLVEGRDHVRLADARPDPPVEAPAQPVDLDVETSCSRHRVDAPPREPGPITMSGHDSTGSVQLSVRSYEAWMPSTKWSVPPFDPSPADRRSGPSRSSPHPAGSARVRRRPSARCAAPSRPAPAHRSPACLPKPPGPGRSRPAPRRSRTRSSSAGPSGRTSPSSASA